MFTKQEIKDIENELGISEESVKKIFSFLESNHKKKIGEVFIALFANSEFDELERLFCAYVMGIDMGTYAKNSNPGIMIVHLGDIDPDEE